MSLKKVLGYFCIVIASILSLSIIRRLPELITDITAFFMIFSGKMEDYSIGFVLGHLLGWVLLFALIIWLWRYGLKNVKRQPDTERGDSPVIANPSAVALCVRKA